MVNIIDSTYEKSDLEQVTENETQLNADERTQLLGLLKELEDLFDVIIGHRTCWHWFKALL